MHSSTRQFQAPKGISLKPDMGKDIHNWPLSLDVSQVSHTLVTRVHEAKDLGLSCRSSAVPFPLQQ